MAAVSFNSLGRSSTFAPLNAFFHSFAQRSGTRFPRRSRGRLRGRMADDSGRSFRFATSGNVPVAQAFRSRPSHPQALIQFIQVAFVLWAAESGQDAPHEDSAFHVERFLDRPGRGRWPLGGRACRGRFAPLHRVRRFSISYCLVVGTALMVLSSRSRTACIPAWPGFLVASVLVQKQGFNSVFW